MKNNIMKIDGYTAIVTVDLESGVIRGEFIGLNGGADFYAESIHDLEVQARQSLQVFLDVCKENNIEPRKSYSGKLQLRLDEAMHESVAAAAASKGVSLNQFIADAVGHELEAA